MSSEALGLEIVETLTVPGWPGAVFGELIPALWLLAPPVPAVGYVGPGALELKSCCFLLQVRLQSQNQLSLLHRRQKLTW